MATELAESEGRFAAEVGGHDESASYREICPLPRALNRAHHKYRTGGHVHRLPVRHGPSIERRAHSSTA